MKIQLTAFDINGKVYKQGLYQTQRRVWSAKNLMNNRYGGGLRFQTMEVEDKVMKPLRVPNIESSHCFCPNTPLMADKCSTCGKSPYTD